MAKFDQPHRVDVGLCASCAWLATLVAAAVLADLLPLAESKDVSKTLRTRPFLRPDLFSAHPLGTDGQGLDVLGGVIYGARVSLVIGVGAVLIAAIVGSSFGVAAGFNRGKLESAIRVVSDAMLAFPPLVLLLAIVAVRQPGIRNVTIALSILGIPVYIRLARAHTLAVAQRDFILAARAVGARNRRIIMREVVPNVLSPLMSFGFAMVATVMAAEASLSFLGLSVRRPTPTWGNMIAAGEDNFETSPHLVFVPGCVLFLTVFAINRLGDRFGPSASELR